MPALPPYVYDVLPEVSDLVAAIEPLEAEHDRLAAELRASSDDLMAFRATRPLAADLEQARREHDARRAAVDRAAGAVGAAQRRVHDTIEEAARSGALREAAARYALEQSEAAEALWSALQATLAARDGAYRHAWSPGHAWTARAHVANLGDLARAEQVIGGRVHGFDTAAVRLVASGEPVAPAAAEAGQSVEDAAKAASMSPPQRSRAATPVRVGYIDGKLVAS